MEEQKHVSGGFIIIISVIVMGVSGFCYMAEKKFIENSMTITLNICDIMNEPRRRVLRVKKEEGRVSDPIFFVTIPFWDKRKIGEPIRLRIANGVIPQVKVDTFIYLHKTSIGILAGCSILLLILLGIFSFSRKNSDS